MMVLRLGSALRQSLLFRCTPLVLGRRPVSVATRDGFQATEMQYAWLKSVPRLAKRSRFGVLMGDLGSSREMPSFMSSMTMNRTFGFCDSPLAEPQLRESKKGCEGSWLFPFL